MQVGDIYKSNYWGDVKVLEYRNSKFVTVEFVNTGHTITTQKHNIERGLIADLEQQKYETCQRDKAQREVDTLPHRVKMYGYKITRLNKYIEKIQAEYNKVQERLKTIKSVYDTSYFHERYGEYKVVDYKPSVKLLPTDICTVRFTVSGYEHNYKLRDVQLGTVRDYKQFPIELQAKLRATEHYEKNRDKIIAQAKLWQIVNRERANTRNRNYRAKKHGAEGTHTDEELSELLIKQEGLCGCCKFPLPEDHRHVDHKQPLSRGGSNWISNLEWLCEFCNLAKSNLVGELWDTYKTSPEFMARRIIRQY